MVFSGKFGVVYSGDYGDYKPKVVFWFHGRIRGEAVFDGPTDWNLPNSIQCHFGMVRIERKPEKNRALENRNREGRKKGFHFVQEIV